MWEEEPWYKELVARYGDQKLAVTRGAMRGATYSVQLPKVSEIMVRVPDGEFVRPSLPDPPLTERYFEGETSEE